jgi:Tfp pilus assembly protein PilF
MRIVSIRRLAAFAGTLWLASAAALAASDSGREYSSPAPPPQAAAATATLDGAELKVNSGDYRGAMPMLAAIIQNDPRNTDALNLMGFSLRKTGQYDLALRYYYSALALQPKHIGANEYLGELYVVMGQVDKAKERLAILQAACGANCVQARELSDMIAHGPSK